MTRPPLLHAREERLLAPVCGRAGAAAAVSSTQFQVLILEARRMMLTERQRGVHRASGVT